MNCNLQPVIDKQRCYSVVVANEYIRNVLCEFNRTELKLMRFIISKVKPSDRVFHEYVFPLNEYCRVAGIEPNNGKNIRLLINALTNLRDKSYLLSVGEGVYSSVSFINKWWFITGTRTVCLRLDDDIQRYLTGLCANYTQYELLCILPMQSTYSIRMYELLKSYAFIGSHTFTIEELRGILLYKKEGTLERYPDFRKKVLEISEKEINQYTDLKIGWQPISEGRKVRAISFSIRQRSGAEKEAAFYNANRALDA